MRPQHFGRRSERHRNFQLRQILPRLFCRELQNARNVEVQVRRLVYITGDA